MHFQLSACLSLPLLSLVRVCTYLSLGVFLFYSFLVVKICGIDSVNNFLMVTRVVE